MIKKSIKYTDYEGVERTEDFYFNLSKAEIVEMELTTVGGLTNMINKIVATQDGPEIIKLFKELILKAYGEKSADGKRFIKTQQLRNEFEQTEAYSQLFMELVTDTTAAAAFVNGIIPADARAQIEGQANAENIKKLAGLE